MNGRILISVVTVAALGLATWAYADDHQGKQRETAPSHLSPALISAQKVYQQECSACHIAYPARLLLVKDWQSVTQDLSLHYGDNASVDGETLSAINTWVQGMGATDTRRYTQPKDSTELPRITTTRWFVRKHAEDEISPRHWQLAKSPANCQACHTSAEQGRFDESNIRLPR